MYTVDNGYEPFRFIHFNIQAIPNGVLAKPLKPTQSEHNAEKK